MRPLRAINIGGGPGGLYLALLLKRADPRHDVVVLERNQPDDTFGFGVVFSDQTMAGIAAADAAAFGAIEQHLVRWDDIAVHYGGELIRSTGHGFSGMSRRTLLATLQRQAVEVGVRLVFGHDVEALDRLGDVDLIVGADGINSAVRRLAGDRFQVDVDMRPNRFVWLGTSKPFPDFTFYFREDASGVWRVHAYQYAPDRSTFIVECRDETWRRSGMDAASEAETVAFLEALFRNELDGHRLIANKSVWRQFPTIRVTPWSLAPSAGEGSGPHLVLLGDAAHTAHFSVGSGTRMSMEDAVALSGAIAESADVGTALTLYETRRRPPVESLQRAAQASLQWFEDTERYMQLAPLQFAFSLLTRSLRITHEDLRKRDPAFLARVDALVEDLARKQVTVGGRPPAASPLTVVGSGFSPASPSASTPPMFTPFRLRDLVIPNRVVVSPMCQYVAADGTVGDWHVVHLGSRAIGGAGLVMAEMTDVSREARISPQCAGLYKEAHAHAWRRVVDFIHRESAGQGRDSAGSRRPQGGDATVVGGRQRTARCRRRGRWCRRRRCRTFPDRSQTPARDDAAKTWTRSVPISCGLPSWPSRLASISSRFTWRMATCSPRSSRR